VLDEADRMLDMGFITDVRKIIAALPRQRQSLLFSATLEGRVIAIGKELLKDPAQIQLAHVREQHAMIQQWLHHADDVTHKRRLLAHHLGCHTLTKAVIFTATKRKADRLARALSDEGHSTAALHGDMSQNARRRTMEAMKDGQIKVLVATDVASRGLDIKGISHVFNFDLPMVPEDYIHRIGRTGRAGANGKAISLIGPEDREKLTGIERLTGQRISRETVPGLEPVAPEPQHGRPAHHGQARGGFGQPGGRTHRPHRAGGNQWRANRGNNHRKASTSSRFANARS
jgi:superfamily II DNA/RNA helicase